MLDSVRRQVIPGDDKCLAWAPSAVEERGGQAGGHRRGHGTALRVRMGAAGHAGSRRADVGAIPGQSAYGEILGGLCEVVRWAHQRECRIAIYREFGAE